MTQRTKPADRLRARIAGFSTERLIELHGKILALSYSAADGVCASRKADVAEPYVITVEFIADELTGRGIEFTTCCYCPVGHHDERTCDRNGPTPLTEAADEIMKGLGRVH